ncbi:hypothetical protein [Ottowia sp.]|uniref:hypothetical protein n=1 Tax=Ottowia sp. TaxID=1898956 RepID=UPI0039E335B6
MSVFLFALQHWGALLFFALSCYGIGWCVLAVCRASRDDAQGRWLQVAAGVALHTAAMLALAVAGHLRAGPLVALLAAGGVVGLACASIDFNAWRAMRNGDHRPPRDGAGRATRLGAGVLAAVVLLPFLLLPLRPPLIWDEVMYHLPHAREWAESGLLTVNTWLRYPWSPAGMSVLYAAALVLMGDVLPHVVSAGAGLLVAALIASEGQRWGRGTAVLASVIWLALSISEYKTATSDLGLVLFVFGSLLAAGRWIERRDREGDGWLLVGGLLLGAALGVKYHAMLFALPCALVLGYAHFRQPVPLRTWAGVVALVALPCGYWYLRNWGATGNPINPLAPSVFGYFDWNARDMAFQHWDLDRAAKPPPPIVYVAALAPLLGIFRRSPVVRAFYGWSLVAAAIWLATSRFPRYLMPAYPVIALLAAAVLTEAGRRCCRAAARWPCTPALVRARGALAPAGMWVGAVLAAVLVFGAKDHIELGKIATRADEREAILRGSLAAYPIVHELPDAPGQRIYQIGLEYLIYYLPRGVRGDHFGPWRYADYDLPPQALADKLRTGGFAYLLMDADTFRRLRGDPDWAAYFRQTASVPGAAVLAVR